MTQGRLPELVAVGGRKRAGKGMIADRLVSEHGYVAVKFATALKAMLHTLLLRSGVDGATAERLVEGDLKEMPLPPPGGATAAGLPACLDALPFAGRSCRHAMQTLGDWGRGSMAPFLWLDIACFEAEAHIAAGRRVVIDDMRFPNEAARMIGKGAARWKVINLRLPPPDDGHASEVELPDEVYTHFIVNDADIPALWERVDEALARP